MPSAPALSEAAQAWAATKDTTSQAVLEDFIRQFGNTVYGSLAKARLEELKSTAQSRPAQSLEALVPETVPYVHDSDRAVIRNVYLSAPDHKALAISITQIGFVSGQATDEAAKTAALASCQKTTDAGGPIAAGQRCELYALGNTVVLKPACTREIIRRCRRSRGGFATPQSTDRSPSKTFRSSARPRGRLLPSAIRMPASIPRRWRYRHAETAVIGTSRVLMKPPAGRWKPTAATDFPA